MNRDESRGFERKRRRGWFYRLCVLLFGAPELDGLGRFRRRPYPPRVRRDSRQP